tara:strand:+ start:350 stop:1087 length:738 start_codon:yes stop_codon:yes gene_type:complete
MKLGIIIPTFQEEKNIKGTLTQASEKLLEQDIPHEIIIVDDNSNDETNNIVNSFLKKNKNIRFYLNDKKKGFGNSIVMGINKCSSDFLTILMADKSDSIDDLIKYYNIIKDDKDLDCIFGDRWSKNSPKNYPVVKRFFNRMGNKIIGTLFRINYYDFTNSFKMYKRSSLIKIYPILSNHFSITIELPLKMVTRGFNYKIIDNSWENREHGVSKMKLFNSLITYSIIIIYCLIDKYFWNKRYINNK